MKLKKIAVHLHIYYKEQISEILTYLKNLRNTDHDIFVTITKYDKKLMSQLYAFSPNIKVTMVENRGYDVGPFISFINSIDLNNYEYVLKVHTKNKNNQSYTTLNGNRLDNKLWCKILWDSMLKDKQRVADNLAIMDNNKNIGMLGSYYCYTDSPTDYKHLLKEINKELIKLKFLPLNKVPFIAGTMFLARANLLQPLKKYNINDFAITSSKVKDGTLAHVFERLFSAIIIQQGYRLYPLKHDIFWLKLLTPTIKRFIYQKKITNSGKLIIKVCKIPVYSRKEAI
ncbi:MAG: hypothetical protein IJE43_26215 [Alphaproteobacteria bacterium]|nr:hypothetical protein [Alphaproteobacteria bacterium]